MSIALDGTRLNQLVLGRNLFQQGHVEESMPYFEAFLERTPSDTKSIAKGHYWLAECYFRLSDYEMALVEYNQAIEHDPDDFQTYFDRGFLYQKLKMLEASIDDFSHAIKLNAEFASAYHNRGIAYKHQNNLDAAINDLRMAISIGKRSETFRSTKTTKALVDILISRAIRFAHTGKTMDALKIYDEVVLLAPEKCLSERASIYEELGQWANAADDYTLLLQYRPNCMEAYQGRAAANKKLERWEEASQDLEALLDMVPSGLVSEKLTISKELRECRIRAIQTGSFDLAETNGYRDEDYR